MVIMMMIVVVLVGDIVMMFMTAVVHTALLARFLQLRFEHASNRRVFLLLFDLFDFERDPETLGKVSFSDGEISSNGGAGVEVLMEPEVRRRYDRTGLPIHFHSFRVFQIVFAG